MAKRVGLGSAAHLPTGLTADVERLQGPDRRTALARTAERGEVVLAEQALRAAGHRADIQRTAPTEHDMAAQWTHSGLGIVDAIDIAPPQRGEPGVEIRRHLSNAQDTYIRWQYSSQAAQRGWCKVRPDSGREVGMRDLARSVHTGISSASNRQLDGRDAGNALERGLDDALDRSSSGLHGPARECRSVIAQIQPNANEPAVPDRGGGLVATQLTTSTDTNDRHPSGRRRGSLHHPTPMRLGRRPPRHRHPRRWPTARCRWHRARHRRQPTRAPHRRKYASLRRQRSRSPPNCRYRPDPPPRLAS